MTSPPQISVKFYVKYTYVAAEKQNCLPTVRRGFRIELWGLTKSTITCRYTRTYVCMRARVRVCALLCLIDIQSLYKIM